VNDCICPTSHVTLVAENKIVKQDGMYWLEEDF
jgi:hypothetical protein